MTTLARLSPPREGLLMQLVYAARSLPVEPEEDPLALRLGDGLVWITFDGLSHTIVAQEEVLEELVDHGYLEWRSAPKALRPFAVTLHGFAYVDQVEILRYRLLGQQRAI
jgi:hypothetical protein